MSPYRPIAKAALRLGLLALAALPLLPAGCERRGPQGVSGSFPAVTLRGQTWLVDLALTTTERYRGLSGRRTLSQGVGMLFIYPQPQELRFCMRDCYIPLDIAFLDADRRVVKMYTMQVEDDLAGEVAYSSVVPAQYALEVSAGALEKAGVRVGDQATFAGDIPPPAKAEPGL